ncbi:MAG: hypothetical protein [Siphoviridae sp. ct7UA22]|nr:MAG: hypothetical protein [Siphoviridae sp. ct7UA22]
MAEKTQQELDVVTELADFRRRVLAGEDIPDEELQKAIEKLRTFREKTAEPIKKVAVKKAATKTTKKEALDFFKDL